MKRALLAILLALPNPAHADRADELLDEGARLFTDEADYAGSLAALEESHRLRPSWRALNGIGLVRQQMGQLVAALETYEQLVTDFAGELTGAQRATVDRRIAALLAQIAVVTVVAPQPGVRVLVDGKVVGTGPLSIELRLMPGEHAIHAEGENLEPATRDVRAEPGSRDQVTIELEAAEVRVVVTERPVQLERRFPSWVPWATAAAGGGLAIASAGYAIASRRDFDAFDASIAADAGDEPEAVPGDLGLLARAEQRRDTAIGLAIGAGAVLGTSLVLWAINRPRPIEVAPAPGGDGMVVTVRGRF